MPSHPLGQKKIGVVDRFVALSKEMQDPRLKLQPYQSLKKEMGHWDGLLNTFSVLADQNVAFKELRAADWNPFNQQLLLYQSDPVAETFEGDFTRVRNVISNFILDLHEAAHIALWEPFFLGIESVKSRQQFLEYSLAFEGACFWFTDCVCTPNLRDALPDFEIVRSRNSATSDFLPYRALKALGADSPKETFDIYFGGIRGNKNKLFRSKNKFSLGLRTRVFQFYLGALKPLGQVYGSLESIGVFSEFQERFCLPSLPTFLSPSTLSARWTNNSLSAYCWKMLTKEMPEIHTLDSTTLQKIRLRRAIQTRSYFALSVRNVVEHHRIFTTKGRWKKSDRDHSIDLLNRYLDRLESGITKLANGCEMEASASIAKADHIYDQFRFHCRQKEAWVATRNYYLPALGDTRGVFGLSATNRDRKSPIYSKKYCNDVIKLLLQDENRRLCIDPNRLRLAGEIASHLQNRNFKSRKTQNKLRRLIDEAMVIPDVLKHWSVRLSDINPKRSNFLEPSFQYV